MTLTDESLRWAIDFVSSHSDGDLFPRLLEMQAVVERSADLAALLEGKDFGALTPGVSRRFIVPKDELSYRQATQLDPQDSIILSAIIYQFGQGIGNRRLPDDRVFSYRFRPDASPSLYRGDSAWNAFWTKAHDLSSRCGAVLYCDIADFYNQIYHHTVENQLIASGFPNQAKRWVISLLESLTSGVSRGVPIGPHAIHLLAEATLIPIDASLAAFGIRFIRFADDIVVFCGDEPTAKGALARIADVLDKQQRLILQRHKTKIFAPDDFQLLCTSMIEDHPISSDEEELINIVRKYVKGDCRTLKR